MLCGQPRVNRHEFSPQGSALLGSSWLVNMHPSHLVTPSKWLSFMMQSPYSKYRCSRSYHQHFPKIGIPLYCIYIVCETCDIRLVMHGDRCGRSCPQRSTTIWIRVYQLVGACETCDIRRLMLVQVMLLHNRRGWVKALRLVINQDCAKGSRSKRQP
jgi:hypothetical protein